MSSVFDSLWADTLPAKKTAKTKVKLAEIPKPQYPAPVCDEAEFLRTVENHKLTILRDEGLYRHLRLKKEGTSNRWYELITWPDKLCVSGDMGTYVFTRVEDMFTFFRPERGDKGQVPINPGYWAQKCISHDRDGIKKFCPETFKANVLQYLQESEIDEECWQAVVAKDALQKWVYSQQTLYWAFATALSSEVGCNIGWHLTVVATPAQVAEAADSIIGQ